jgi:hypothetical protein
MNFQNDIREGSALIRLPLVSNPRRNYEQVTGARNFTLGIGDCGSSPFTCISKLLLYQIHTRLQDCTAAAYKDYITPVIMYLGWTCSRSRQDNELVEVLVADSEFASEIFWGFCDGSKCGIDGARFNAHHRRSARLSVHGCREK